MPSPTVGTIYVYYIILNRVALSASAFVQMLS
jgi:hypothetical protein